jgi:hypothetical protein
MAEIIRAPSNPTIPADASRLPNWPNSAGPGGAVYLPFPRSPEAPTVKLLPREGLRVVLEPIPDLTDKGLLTRAGMTFQCPPLESFDVNYAHSHTDYETINAQHSRKNVPQLTSVQFQTLVCDYATFAVNPDSPAPEDVRDLLIEICTSGSPFLLTAAHLIPRGGYGVTSFDPEVQMPATLRSLKVSEKSGEGDTRYFDVSFTEYSDVTMHRKGKGGKRRASKKLPTHIELYSDGSARDAEGKKLGDPPRTPITFSFLAKHFYGDPSLARYIASHNSLPKMGMTEAIISYAHPRNKLKISIPSKPSLKGGMFSGVDRAQTNVPGLL